MLSISCLTLLAGSRGKDELNAFFCNRISPGSCYCRLNSDFRFTALGLTSTDLTPKIRAAFWSLLSCDLKVRVEVGLNGRTATSTEGDRGRVSLPEARIGLRPSFGPGVGFGAIEQCDRRCKKSVVGKFQSELLLLQLFDRSGLNAASLCWKAQSNILACS